MLAPDKHLLAPDNNPAPGVAAWHLLALETIRRPSGGLLSATSSDRGKKRDSAGTEFSKPRLLLYTPPVLALDDFTRDVTMKGRDLATIDAVEKVLLQHDYVADRVLATVVFLSLKLGKPLLLEGEAGVGKTQVAKTLAEVLDAPLIRLQCYEGLDVNNTIYEWNYTRQLLHIRMLEAQSCDIDASVERDLFGEEYLIKRPLLQAIELSAGGQAPVLLIDELDRADEEFEAFLLELLSDFQITIPEIGTMRAARPPVVVITSNRTREIHDALKRRCIYHWIDYPTLEKEYSIVNLKVPGASALLAGQLVHFVQELRRLDLYKLPGVAETLDWAEALVTLDARELELPVVEETLGLLLKYQDDFEAVRKGQVERILSSAQTRATERMLQPPPVSCA